MIRKLIAMTFVAAIVLSSQVVMAEEGPYVEGTVDTTSIVNSLDNAAEGDGILAEIQVGSVMSGELFGDVMVNADVSNVCNYGEGDNVEASITLGGFGE